MEIRKIRLAIIVNSLYLGGSEKMVAQLVNGLDYEKFEVLLIVNHKNSFREIEKFASESKAKIVYTNKNDGFSFMAYFKIWKILNGFSPQIIHTHLSTWIYSVQWAFVHRIRIIHTIHSAPEIEARGLMRTIISIAYRISVVTPVAISFKIRDDFSTLYKMPQNKIEVIFNPVDIEMYKPVIEKEDSIVCFVCVCRLVESKNISMLIDAFSIVLKKISCRLMIIGDGELYEYLINKVEMLNLSKSISFLGRSNSVFSDLQKSDIFVLTSKFEGLPLSILEAMATGLPIIATNVGGISDIVTDNGIIIEPNNLISLVDAMIFLAQDKEIRYKMGLRSRQNVLKYDIKEISKQYERVYMKYSRNKIGLNS